jgi:16S rRNA processing protein RimM
VKSIDRKDFLLIGSVSRIHGTKGELKVRVEHAEDIVLLSPEKEWAFLEIRNKPVPFFIEAFKPTMEGEGILSLRNVNTVEEAEALAGLNILGLEKDLSEGGKPGKDLTGFMLVDKELGELGKIKGFEELPGQLLFMLDYNGKEILIPAVEDFITGINRKKKVVNLDLPEGLLDQ